MGSRVPFRNLAEAERLARRKLPRAVWLAVKAGNEQGWTLDDNRRVWDEIALCPTVFDRPEQVAMSTSVMGVDIDFPVMVSPVGAQALHPGGEVAAAAAAREAGTVMGLSSWASDSVRDVVQANPDVFFQLYWVGSKEDIERRVEAAREAGAKALIVTLDWSHTPRRDWGVPPAPPSDLSLRTMLELAPGALSRPLWFGSYLRRGRIPELRVPNLFTPTDPAPYFGQAWAEFERTPAPTAADVQWLRDLWGGPFMVKGINTIRDARIAADLGADAISVSNHGGNNIDGTASPMRSLPYIVDAVGDRVEVIADGGIRRGSDVVKAVALGARAVFVGRAYLYGLSVAGQAGVLEVLNILRNGVRETMFGIGRSNLSELSMADLMFMHDHVLREPTR